MLDGVLLNIRLYIMKIKIILKTKQQQKKGPELGSFQAKGLKLLQMEIELYPESATFIAPILKKYKN